MDIPVGYITISLYVIFSKSSFIIGKNGSAGPQVIMPKKRWSPGDLAHKFYIIGPIPWPTRKHIIYFARLIILYRG